MKILLLVDFFGFVLVYNFSRLYLGHHYYILYTKFTDLWLVVEKIIKDIMHFYYMTYMATP